jgi:endoglucanase
VLEATPAVSVYIDAGHARWIAADDMAARLEAAGVGDADGFSLNVGNFIATEENIQYGRIISERIGQKHFIIDTGRNGNGATFEGAWCNPKGRALGTPPTTLTGDPLVDAFVWIKSPGESDGECNGGPKIGEFWPEEALAMARRTRWLASSSIARGPVETPEPWSTDPPGAGSTASAVGASSAR